MSAPVVAQQSNDPRSPAVLRSLEPNEVSRWIRYICSSAHISPTALARLAGVAPSTLNRFLKGEEGGNVPSTRTLNKIQNAALTLELSKAGFHPSPTAPSADELDRLNIFSRLSNIDVETYDNLDETDTLIYNAVRMADEIIMARSTNPPLFASITSDDRAALVVALLQRGREARSQGRRYLGLWDFIDVIAGWRKTRGDTQKRA